MFVVISGQVARTLLARTTKRGSGGRTSYKYLVKYYTRFFHNGRVSSRSYLRICLYVIYTEADIRVISGAERFGALGRQNKQYCVVVRHRENFRGFLMKVTRSEVTPDCVNRRSFDSLFSVALQFRPSCRHHGVTWLSRRHAGGPFCLRLLTPPSNYKNRR